ncbi:hypothetical protein LCGC14_2122420 [marine sediment metagenome]|uniref:Uncharacterized protein n=1 Tax=marine sediment metagenome TaxID=412755 RepID=A0A0F9DFL1_9ZZZZ
MSNIRYYMGRHKISILVKKGKKALVVHLEKGYVGNKEIGYKDVHPGDIDSTMVRFCRGIKSYYVQKQKQTFRGKVL